MQYLNSQHSYLYQHEILRAKLKIRDHYFKTIVREIYENTGQILSLVHVQLAIVETQIKEDIKTNIARSRNLVGRAIYDLRDMSKNLFPENEILSESGLADALKRELESYAAENAINKIKVKGIPFALSEDDGLVFFLVIIEIVNGIATEYGVESLEMTLAYSNKSLKISMSYFGKPMRLNEPEHISDQAVSPRSLGLQERLSLIGGEITVKAKTNKKSRIEVSLPYDNFHAA